MLGVAAVLGGIGAGFGIAESQLHADAVTADHSTTTRQDINRKRDLATNYSVAAYLGLSLGAGALIAASILFIVDPSRRERHAPQNYVLLPTVTQGGAGLAAAVRF
jgi:hypothetical protein